MHLRQSGSIEPRTCFKSMESGRAHGAESPMEISAASRCTTSASCVGTMPDSERSHQELVHTRREGTVAVSRRNARRSVFRSPGRSFDKECHHADRDLPQQYREAPCHRDFQCDWTVTDGTLITFKVMDLFTL